MHSGPQNKMETIVEDTMIRVLFSDDTTESDLKQMFHSVTNLKKFVKWGKIFTLGKAISLTRKQRGHGPEEIHNPKYWSLDSDRVRKSLMQGKDQISKEKLIESRGGRGLDSHGGRSRRCRT